MCHILSIVRATACVRAALSVLFLIRRLHRIHKRITRRHSTPTLTMLHITHETAQHTRCTRKIIERYNRLIESARCHTFPRSTLHTHAPLHTLLRGPRTQPPCTRISPSHTPLPLAHARPLLVRSSIIPSCLPQTATRTPSSPLRSVEGPIRRTRAQTHTHAHTRTHKHAHQPASRTHEHTTTLAHTPPSQTPFPHQSHPKPQSPAVCGMCVRVNAGHPPIAHSSYYYRYSQLSH